MSHQTGIKANSQLKKFFGKCRDGRVRVFKVSIENEELSLTNYKETKHSWQEDYDKYVKPMVEPNQPCYILFRLDTKHETGGYNWLLISWSPDDSPIRQKMLYASTKATLKQEFGSNQIKEEMHATIMEEVTVAGLEKHRVAAKSPAPKTQREEEMSELTTGFSAVSIESKSQGLGSVAMPVESAARLAISQLGTNFNYIRLRIDMGAEKIVLDSSTNIDVVQLPNQVPTDCARYHLFRYFYFHQIRKHEATFFIYSMPGYNCPIKERMLYSSCKGPLLDTIEQTLNMKIDKKLEVDSGKELTGDFLYSELHPKTETSKEKFEKPRMPQNRGPRRITKPSAQCSLLH